MHTFKASDGTKIIYNPDLSDVRIVVDNDHIEDVSYLADLTNDPLCSHVHVSGVAMLEFITEYYRKKMIEDLEQLQERINEAMILLQYAKQELDHLIEKQNYDDE